MTDFHGIDRAPDVCGGEPRIANTRIPVWILVQARRLGTCDADILRIYPSLEEEDLVNAWNYYQHHQDEIEQQIRTNETA
jgi:uncharacterized protein (DUF433 family)